MPWSDLLMCPVCRFENGGWTQAERFGTAHVHVLAVQTLPSHHCDYTPGLG